MLDKNDPLVKKLIDDEGWRNFPYVDSEGYWTIGVGHLIDRRMGGSLPTYIRTFPLTDDEVLRVLEDDVLSRRHALQGQLPWVLDLDPPRLRVVFSMLFQLGMGGLLKFKDTLAALKAKNWPGAAAGIRSSRAYRQTTKRWERHAKIIETGKEEV